MALAAAIDATRKRAMLARAALARPRSWGRMTHPGE